MNLEERQVGDYRIYAAAFNHPKGEGHVAAVVVSRVCGVERGPQEVFRDECMANGHGWPTPTDALNWAVCQAQLMICVFRSAPYRRHLRLFSVPIVSSYSLTGQDRYRSAVSVQDGLAGRLPWYIDTIDWLKRVHETSQSEPSSW